MPSPSVWNVVLDAASDADVVLATDFPVTGRNEGGFADLTPSLGLDCALWQTVAPARAPGPGIDPDEYLAPWLAEVAASGRRVRAVLGYCAGSVFAGALAERIADRQPVAPQVVVFDPELVDVPTVHLQFGRVIGNMTAVLTPAEVDELAGAAERLAARPGITPAAFATELYAIFEPIGSAALRRAGLDEGYAGELVALVGSFMTYLGVAAGLDPRPGWSRATVVTSASPASGLNRMRATPGLAPIAVADEVRFEVEHRDLLRTPEVATTVAGLLGTGSQARR
ncbi:hypothetical protein [Streptomyces collinus]|uniref:Polyketide synthase thioesterase domain-containing protein n=2 Tax=Streptomyces collinus TaxID=42684 RepID=S5VFF6_STRC3|nr:hypothetical protein [Streptomyces collinus]AGS67165.1 protein of unknown function putatively involved in kirromycin biosynthesis or resistance [Streptomyces collinus Tu 365]AGS73529.1 protein of unknown function putatively involved in kirromycin biosynthesis or resistance [Streptomyces collinus Tu 365]CAN89637.1 hypothetical protein [Streptomyces collinus Tu 365]